jgi:acetylglutamate kinase
MTSKDSTTNAIHAGNEKQLLYIIKTGGNVIDDAESLEAFLKDFASITGKKILVHGGGKIATTIGEKLGIEPNYIDGRRITNDATIDLVTMVYGGLLNKKIVAALQSLQCNAIGLTGPDANVLPAIKRPVKTIDYGWVGDIDSAVIDHATWQLFLDNGLVPVVASLTHDGLGHMLNTNADTIAAVLARALAKVYHIKLVFCFEKSGVLEDVNDEHSLVAQLNTTSYAALKESKKLFAGILPKIDNAFDAISNGVEEVVFGNSRLLLELINGSGGTKLVL